MQKEDSGALPEAAVIEQREALISADAQLDKLLCGSHGS